MSQARPIVCQLLHGLRVGGAEVLAARLARQLSGTHRCIFVCLDELGRTFCDVGNRSSRNAVLPCGPSQTARSI